MLEHPSVFLWLWRVLLFLWLSYASSIASLRVQIANILQYARDFAGLSLLRDQQKIFVYCYVPAPLLKYSSKDSYFCFWFEVGGCLYGIAIVGFLASSLLLFLCHNDPKTCLGTKDSEGKNDQLYRELVGARRQDWPFLVPVWSPYVQ